ncbi:TIGR00282 family metallophosphoesterase [bacterium]|nr:TIGR00282 family metallophosphoesterase [bacterium]
MNILFIADIVGRPGLKAVEHVYPRIRDEESIDITIANGENAAAGKGLLPADADFLFDMGIDVITSGNHIWNKQKLFEYFESRPALLRPANYPASCPGRGFCLVEAGGVTIGILNLQGRSFLQPIDCPFLCADAAIDTLRNAGAGIIVTDFHAEATAEKIALGYYLDGRASAVIGTHTHVQTADERILPNGTAFITDAGMTGPMDSVIGMDREVAIKRFLTQMPQYYKVAANDVVFSGVVISIDPITGKANSIRRVSLPL